MITGGPDRDCALINRSALTFTLVYLFFSGVIIGDFPELNNVSEKYSFFHQNSVFPKQLINSSHLSCSGTRRTCRNKKPFYNKSIQRMFIPETIILKQKNVPKRTSFM
jgi:hypothetical protein